jgi:hypothetical protein
LSVRLRRPALDGPAVLIEAAENIDEDLVGPDRVALAQGVAGDAKRGGQSRAGPLLVRYRGQGIEQMCPRLRVETCQFDQLGCQGNSPS